MRKISPLKIKIRPASEKGIFHDSRSDVRLLSAAMNHIIEKQNEIISAVNRLIDAQGGPSHDL